MHPPQSHPRHPALLSRHSARRFLPHEPRVLLAPVWLQLVDADRLEVAAKSALEMQNHLLPFAEHAAHARGAGVQKCQTVAEGEPFGTSHGINQLVLTMSLTPQGVYTTLFRPEARDHSLRRTWGAEPSGPDISGVVAETFSNDSRRSSLELASPPPASFPQAKQSKVVMLYVGRISWEKNLRLLVEAFRGLQLASADGLRPACQLVFVGDGPSRPELESLCASYNLDAVFMGYRKGEELAAAFASADIFAFPSW